MVRHRVLAQLISWLVPIDLAAKVFPLMGMFPTGKTDVLGRPAKELRPAGEDKWYFIGTCFSVGGGRLLTARHLVRGEGRLSIVVEGQRHDLSVLWADSRTNLCCLSLPGNVELVAEPLLPRRCIDEDERECFIAYYLAPDAAPRTVYKCSRPDLIKIRVDCEHSTIPKVPVLQDGFAITIGCHQITASFTAPALASGAPVLYRQFHRLRLAGVHCGDLLEPEQQKAPGRPVAASFFAPVLERDLASSVGPAHAHTAALHVACPSDLLFDPSSDDDEE